MEFVPGTWASMGVDCDADGRADIQLDKARTEAAGSRRGSAGPTATGMRLSAQSRLSNSSPQLRNSDFPHPGVAVGVAGQISRRLVQTSTAIAASRLRQPPITTWAAREVS